MANLLYSIHDRDAHPLVPMGGWCIDAVLVTDEPPNYGAIRNDINWIVRLNHGWNPNGTIPVRASYADYAKRCADFVTRSKGANRFIISNEPNHAQEYPHGVKIEPDDYADCFNLCSQAIKAVSQSAAVLVAAIAPWDISGGMDWLAYYARMLNGIDACDGLAVHGYTHGANPALIWDMSKSHGWYWHFPVIYQTIEAIPAKFKSLPVHVTETNQGDNGWVNANSGWVQEAYKSIEGHNGLDDSQKIHSLSLYRWRGDKWQIHDKGGVQDDFKEAVKLGYRSPIGDPSLPSQPDPPMQPHPPSMDEEQRDIDPRLVARGVTFEFAHPPTGSGYWRIVKAQWLDQAEADRVGPDHHILGTIVRAGEEIADMPFSVSWPSGATTIKSKTDQVTIPYNYDFPMSASLNEFAISVNDGNPSDKASGIGMGAHGNPNIHTSTWLEWEWAIAKSIEPPDKPELERGAIIWPVQGPITDDFGTPPARFGCIGHNGIDIACRLDTPVLSIADGQVAYIGEDISYGNYCRVWHKALRFHSFYAHLNSIAVRAGQRVNRGELLALSGSTGNSTGPHLHYECRAADDSGNYLDITYGYTKGRFNPKDAYLVLGSPLSPEK